MALSYRLTQVQAPSSKPTTDNSGTTYWVRHRRVNIGGNHTIWSSPVQTDLPATITPQSYATPLEYKRDEILISDDDTTYRIVPRDDSGKGALSISSFDSSWTQSPNEDTQGSTINSLDFGEFGPSTNPSKVFYVYNPGSSVENLSFNITDNNTFETASLYFDRIQISIDGTYSEKGSGPSSLYNKSIIWGDPNQSFNTIPVLLPSRSFVKIKMDFINFPSSGFESSNLDLNLQIITNNRNFRLPIGSDWYPGSIKTDYIDFVPKIFESTGITGEVKVLPFLLASDGRILANYFEKVVSTGGNVDDKYHIVISRKGSILYYSDGNFSNIPDLSFILGEFVLASGGGIKDVKYNYKIRPIAWSSLPNGTVSEGLFVKANNDTLEICENSEDVIGISLGENGNYTTEGRAWLILGESLSAGTRVKPGTGGKAYAAPEGKFILKDGGDVDDKVVAETLSLTSFIIENPTSSDPEVTFSDITQPVYKPTLDLNFGEVRDGAFTDDHSFPSEVTFTRPSQATRIGANGYIQTVGTDVPRINYDPITKENKGLLIEQGFTNYIKNSEDANNFSTFKTTISNVTTPFSPAKGDCIEIIETTDNGTHGIRNNNISTSTSTYIISIFIKPKGRHKFELRYRNSDGNLSSLNPIYDLSSETPADKIEKYPNGWYRIWGEFNDNAEEICLYLLDSNGNDFYQGDGTSGCYTWGWQVEPKGHGRQDPSSYIPSTSGTETSRANDFAKIETTEFHKLVTPTAGTIYVEFGDFDLGYNNRVFQFSNIRLLKRELKTFLQFETDSPIDTGDYMFNLGDVFSYSVRKGFHKTIFSWDDIEVKKKDTLTNSYEVTTPATNFYSYNTNSGSNGKLILGSWFNSAFNMNGHIRRFMYLSNTLPDEVAFDKMLDSELQLTYPTTGFNSVALPQMGTSPNTEVAEAKLFFQDNALKYRTESNGPIWTIAPTTVQTLAYTTASITDGSSEDFSLELGRYGVFLSITSDAACWLVAYTDSTSRTNDSGRSSGTSPTDNSGVLLDHVFSSSDTVNLSPTTLFHNAESPLTSDIYFKVENQSGSDLAITLEVKAIRLY